MEGFMRGIALAQPGEANERATTAFVEVLQSDEGRRAFEKWTRKAKP